jgi:hypothetical protein
MRFCGWRGRSWDLLHTRILEGPEANEPPHDPVGGLRVAGGPVPLPHAGQPPFPELLGGEPGILLHILPHRLDQLATQVIGQSCILHLPGDLHHLFCPPAEDGFCAHTQLVLEDAVQVSALAGGLDSPGQALADLGSRDATLGRDAQRHRLTHAQALLGREVGRCLSGDQRRSRIGLLLDHLFDELGIEAAIGQDWRASLLFPLACLLVSGPGQVEGSVFDVGRGGLQLGGGLLDLLGTRLAPAGQASGLIPHEERLEGYRRRRCAGLCIGGNE